MDISKKYRFYIGGARGYLQYTECAENEKQCYYKPEKVSEITALEWGINGNVVIGYKSGIVDIYDINLNKYRKVSRLEGNGAVTGLGYVDQSLIVAKQDGTINICRGKTNDCMPTNIQEKATLDCMIYHNNRPNIIGTGGELNDFKLWDLARKQCVFKAKSLGHDKLDLHIPTSIRGIAFLPENEHLSVCATKEGHVLLYDDRAQRRPVTKFREEIKNIRSYTCIATSYREKQCFIGTTTGYLQLLDLRKPEKLLKTFTGYTGSVTSIICDPNEPLVATTSLDRFFRLHNFETKQLIHKVYLKQNLTKMIMKPIVKEEPEENEVVEGNSSDVEYEELFNNMEEISGTVRTAKRKKGRDVNNESGIEIINEKPSKRKKKRINPLNLLKSQNNKG